MMNSPPSHKLPYTTLLHENLSVVVTFAFSRPVLVKCFTDRFQGEWKYLWKACYDIPEQRVNRALLELALQLRLIDDREHLTEYFKTTDEHQRVGKIIKQDGTEDKLRFRDLTNKILHSSVIEWGFDDPDNPVIICHSDEPGRWVKAEIPVLRLAALCAGFMS
jgi:hypothetical protein